MLLAPAWQRMLVASALVAAIWAAVLWVAPSTPSLDQARPAALVAAAPATGGDVHAGPLRAVVWSGLAAPGGGRFDRFDATSHPVAAPVNARGQVAFHATVLRAPGREGIFLATAGQITKVAAFGDALPGGGTLAGFTEHPTPALNAAGHVAFGAEIGGGRGTEGVFLAGEAGMRVVALAGDDAPGLPGGVLLNFEAPTLNDNDEIALMATVRRGRDLLDVLYFWNGQRLQRIVATGDRLLRIRGTMDKIGVPALNNRGVIAFPASLIRGPALGGLFVAGARDLRLMAGAGDRTPSGSMLLRFSDRLAIDDDDDIAFGAHVGDAGATRDAVLRVGPSGLVEVAVEGAEAPGGGRYAGFGPWPSVTSGGVTGFVAALDGGPGPLATFAGAPGQVRRVAAMGEVLSNGRRIGPFAPNAVAMTGPGGLLSFATVADGEGGPGAIYCQCSGAGQ